MVITDARQEAAEIVRNAEMASAEAETRAAASLTDAEKKASEIIAGAERAAVELADRAKATADADSAAIIAEAEKKASQILQDTRQAVKVLAAKTKAETSTKTSAMVADAKQKAAQILLEAKQTARELVSKEAVLKEAQAEAERVTAEARQKAEHLLQETEQAVAESTEKANSEAKLKSANIVNQSLEIAGRMMSLVKGEGKSGSGQKRGGPRAGSKADINRNYQEMIKFVIEDYRAGTLKMDDNKELIEKVKSLKKDDDWESLPSDVKALALINMLKHKVPDA